MLKLFLTIIIVSISIKINAQMYVSPDGDDSNPGTIDFPLKTIPFAVSKVQAGDTIYLRGGVYTLSAKIGISKNGNSNNLYHLFAYNGERPILDFSSMPVNSSNRGINLSGDYWYIKGIDIKGAGDNGMNLSGSYNKIEYCSFYENRDTGLQLGGGASDNQIINCDSYFNVDPGQGNADGFAPKLNVGTNNYFYGCRAWQNSDDGWDGYMRGANDVSTTLENCWSFMNGYLKDGSAGVGNGNGYKMGGSDDKTLMHNFTLKNCISFDNRVKGFDQNNNKGSMILYNCTAYRNGTNYSIVSALNPGKVANVVNCVSLGSYGTLESFVVQQTNSWLSPFVVTDSDFISIDTLGVRGSRKSDGSLPDINFLHLAWGSDLINAGTDVGLPFKGTAPDLGAFESAVISSVKDNKNVPLKFSLLQNYPNPFNPATKIRYTIAASSNVELSVYDILGNEIKVLVNKRQHSGNYEVDFNASNLPSGVYFYKLSAGNSHQVEKMILLK
jgi:Pel9A-like, right handed beta helix region/Secretion system C-terminal sorting domain